MTEIQTRKDKIKQLIKPSKQKLTPLSADVWVNGRNVILEALIAQKGWKQADLARASKVNRAYINLVITGRKTPSRDMMVHIARTLDTDSRAIWP